MSFDSIEKSNASSTPVLFFQFQRGATYWRYTSADRDATMNGVPWSAVPVQVGDASQSGNSDSDTLDLVCPNTIEVAQQFRGQTPSDSVSLTIFQAHALGNIPVVTFDSDIAAVWVGEISDVKQGANDRVTISCKTLSSAFDREGLGPTWGRNCDHVIYDVMCRVNRSNFQATFNLSGVSGGSVTAAALGAHGDGYYDGGYIEWTVGNGVYQRLGIDRQLGTTATLLGTTEALAIGVQVSAYPGCSQTTTDCINKFNNIPNYGGCDIMPGTSPYDGNPVF
jgi:uncharacterized phage protein (TIGR02218 family)